MPEPKKSNEKKYEEGFDPRDLIEEVLEKLDDSVEVELLIVEEE